MKKKKKTKISDQIRDAIESADVTRYRISVETGINEATLSRFMNGTGGMTVETLESWGNTWGWKSWRRKRNAPETVKTA